MVYLFGAKLSLNNNKMFLFNNSRKQSCDYPAFTMIEMIVSVSIIAIVTALFVSNYHDSNSRTDLTIAAQSLVADLHAAQNNTLGLTKYNDLLPGGGWGVHFEKDKNSYVIFADLDAPEEVGYMKYDPVIEGSTRYGARTVELAKGISLISLKTSNLENQQVNVTFLPPDPQTNIYRVLDNATSTALDIQLKNEKTGELKTVRVNFLGLVEVID